MRCRRTVRETGPGGPNGRWTCPDTRRRSVRETSGAHFYSWERPLAFFSGEVKTLADAPAYLGLGLDEIVDAHGMRDQTVWDFATVAVLPRYRGSLAVSSLLYRTFALESLRAGIEHVVVMLDVRAHRNMTLIGVPLEPLAGSEPFAYLGSADTRALYSRPVTFLPAIAEQARALARPGRPHRGRIRHRGWRGLLIRQVAASVSRRIATGRGLDPHIVDAG